MSLPMHLRSYREKSKDELARDFFNAPLPEQMPGPNEPPSVVKIRGRRDIEGDRGGMEINAVLSVEGKEEVYAGRLNLLPPFLCFISLDRRSCRCTLPLYTIRRVERLNSRAGVFALSLATWHGMRIILQLTSLLPTAEHFALLLRDALKTQLPAMKQLKPFLPSLYSEFLLSTAAHAHVGEKPDHLLLGTELGDKSGDGEGDLRGPGGEGKGPYERGLGETFGFPGDARKMRERSKMKLWKEYFLVLRYPPFQRLLQVGLPSRLRGELWEVMSGSVYLRFANPETYSLLLSQNAGKSSQSTDEIEKDLNRSLPEYKAYQTDEGLAKLRRVLVAYSFRNPELGYCQALNIVVAGYMSEEQAFWLLEVLCDRILPGYYSPSMEGTLLDQRVFEALVQRCLPMIKDHFASVDVQLSVASLPWFLSLYINSMPLIFAFRIVDCVLAMGVKVLFQIGLAVLKINGEALLEVTDDGMFISLMRSYFATIGDSAHPNHPDPRVRAITNFQELLVVAFREFNVITDDTIQAERRRLRAIISDEIEKFSKRAAVRNLKNIGQFNKDQTGIIYDHYFSAVCSPQAGSSTNSSGKNTPLPGDQFDQPRIQVDAQGRVETRIDLRTFKVFLSEIATWAREEVVTTNAFITRTERKVADGELIDRLFYAWDSQQVGTLSLQDVVLGLDRVMTAGLMESIEWFFELHDKNKDGYLTKDEVIQLSESLLFIFRNEPGDIYLAAVSKFILNAYEFGDATAPEEYKKATEDLVPIDGGEESASHVRERSNSSATANNMPYLNLATFRMVVLADEILENFFGRDLPASFQLDSTQEEDYHQAHQKPEGLLGGLMNLVVTNENKNRFNRFADGFGAALGKHAEWRKPSLAKAAQAQAAPSPDLSARESLLTPSVTQRGRAPSSASQASVASVASKSSGTTPEGRSLADVEQRYREESEMVRAAQEAVMQRPNFAIDAIGDSDGEEEEGGEDDAVMDEVEAFLKAHGEDDEGLKGEQKKVATGEWRAGSQWPMCPRTRRRIKTNG
ncbi:GTPase-activating protein GYP2 [Saitozyma sp. JCM 24511]|nr:GTPase-activating protein GYP2 [Saitozyma sp. JCM 24511]